MEGVTPKMFQFSEAIHLSKLLLFINNFTSFLIRVNVVLLRKL